MGQRSNASGYYLGKLKSEKIKPREGHPVFVKCGEGGCLKTKGAAKQFCLCLNHCQFWRVYSRPHTIWEQALTSLLVEDRDSDPGTGLTLHAKACKKGEWQPGGQAPIFIGQADD